MSQVSPTELLAAALQWASDGYAVFPVHTTNASGGCSCNDGGPCLQARPSPGKHPRTPNGCKDATLDPAVIRAWWERWPDSNVGIATGNPSGAWAFDVDGPEGRESLAALEAEHGPLPPTMTVSTGREDGGEHRWFRMPLDRDVRNSSGKVGKKLDVRGSGGYVVAPPSLHASGKRYALANDLQPVDPPAWLVELATSQRVAQSVAQEPLPVPRERSAAADLWSAGAGQGAGGSPRVRVLGMVRAAADRIRTTPEGQRNETVNRECFSIGGFLDAGGVSVDEAAAELEPAAVEAEQPRAQVRRALEDGRKHPRALPPDQERPQDRPLNRDPAVRPVPDAAGPVSDSADAGDPPEAEIRAAVAACVEARNKKQAAAALFNHPQLRHLHPCPETERLRAEHGCAGIVDRLLNTARMHRRPVRDQRTDPSGGVLARVTREGENGREYVPSTLATARLILDEDPRCVGRIRRNELSGNTEVDGRPLDDDHVRTITCWLEEEYVSEWSVEKVRHAIHAVGHRHRFHPIRDYLLEKIAPWDGVRRIDRLLFDYFGADSAHERAALYRAYGRNFMLALVARALSHGCKVDDVLTLQGEQGLMKSSGFAALMPNSAFFSDDPVPMNDDKRLGMMLRGRWLIEFAEFSSVKRGDVDAVKAFITKVEDKYVPMHGREVVVQPRSVVFVATVNDDEFLLEAGRRWCVVQVVRRADLDRIKRDRDQLFAEALAAFQAGEQWWLPQELQDEQREDVRRFAVQTPTADLIAEWTHGRSFFDGERFELPDLWDKIMARGPNPRAPTMSESRDFGRALRDAGWTKKKGRNDPGNRWYPPKRS